ncbi:MAG TPA: hypothetical protein VHX44_17320 [Planctomycetota bacterium]|nr:hypothetical protein [Planctomycetota bacterium]
MTPARLRLAMIVGASLLVICWFLWWSSNGVQADRTFARLKSAIENGSAGGVLDNLHRSYDIKASWPNQLGSEGGDIADAIGTSAVRLIVLRGLTGLFQLQSADPFVFHYTIAQVEARNDSTVAVTVSINLSTTSGNRPLTFTPSLTNQRFILAKDGWWPALYVKSHPAFSVAY